MKRLTFVIVFLCFAGRSALAGWTASDSTFPDIKGWKLVAEEKEYTAENLWDVIDGAADLFLEYNFVDLHIGRYKQSGDLEVKVELYRHKSAVDAFGMYSQERYPDYHFIDLGVQGYLERGSLNFLSGPYYVKVSTLQSGQNAQDGMLAVSREVCKSLNQDNSKPGLLDVFPAEGKQANTEQYIARNFLGYAFFNAAFVASYGDGGEPKAFVMQNENAETAKSTLDKYLKSLTKGGSVKEDDGILKIHDPHSGPILIVVKKNFILGVVGTIGGQDPRIFLKQMEDRLPGLK